MDQDDLLARIQEQGRLYGRHEARRATCTVLAALTELLPAPAYRRLHAALPPDLRRRLPRPGAGRICPVNGSRAFVARVADRLLLDGPNAAFLIRVVLGQLNAAGHGCAPADLAALVPADLRPLLRAWPAQRWSMEPAGPPSVGAARTPAATGVAAKGIGAPEPPGGDLTAAGIAAGANFAGSEASVVGFTATGDPAAEATTAATVPPVVRAAADQCRRLPGAAARARRRPHRPTW